MARLIRVSALDMAHSRRRSTVLVGPLALPTVGELVDRYNALAELGPLARLCLEPSTHHARWRRLPVNGSAVISTGERLPVGVPATALLPSIRALRADDVADGLRIHCAGDILAIDFCHGLGEAPLINTILDVLLGAADPRDPAFLAPYRHILPPLLSAGIRTFGPDPRRIATLLSIYRRRPLPAPAAAPVDARQQFQPAPTTRCVGLSAETLAELRHRRDASLPGVSLMALCTYALRESFATVGLGVEDIVKIPFDVRRYLRKESSTLASFSAGLDFAIDADEGPAGLQRAMDRSASCGRPVANLLVGALKARRRHVDGPECQPTRPLVRLLHSNVLRSARTERWPFTDQARAQVLVASDPLSAEGVTVTSAWSAGNLWLTAEFHGTVFDADRVGAALSNIETHMRDLTATLTSEVPVCP